MRTGRVRWTVAWAAGAVAGSLAFNGAQAAPPPVDAFGKVPQIDYAALSPNGNLVAWQDASGTRGQVVVFDLIAAKVKRTFAVDAEIRLRGLVWADDETLLFQGSRTQTARTRGTVRREFSRVVALDVQTGGSRMLLMGGGHRGAVTGATLLARRTAETKTVAMSTLDYRPAERQVGTRIGGQPDDAGWVHVVFHVDTRTGRGVPIEYGTQFTDDWIVDAAGLPVARSEWNPAANAFSILAKRGTSWEDIYRGKDRSLLDLVGLSADGSALLAIGGNGLERSKLWSLPLDGSPASVLLEDASRDVWAELRDPYSRALVGVLLGGLEQEPRWLDGKVEARQKALAKAFPGRNVWMASRSENGQRVLVLVEGPSHANAYYLVDFHTGNAELIGEAYPALANAKLGDVRALSLTARDGADIPSYLTMPAEADAACPPLVVMPHDGPETRDYFRFDWFAQFLASRGYAVLQPQFRGSTGFGEAHRKAGSRQWGGTMQNDVTDAVKAVLARGLADPKRVCMVGTGYGGYAALAGAAFTPDLYACTASINGVSDLPAWLAFVKAQTNVDADLLEYLRDHVGLPTETHVIEKSPARAAASIRAPVLLLHGVDDTRVPIDQSERMARKLAEAGRSHTLVRLPGEDHWLSDSETRMKVLSEVERFLWTHAGSQPASSCAPAAAYAATLGR